MMPLLMPLMPRAYASFDAAIAAYFHAFILMLPAIYVMFRHLLRQSC